MRYHVVAVGRMRNAALRAAADEYVKRLGRYTHVEEREVKDAARLAGAIPDAARLIALSRVGDPWSSADLARWTAQWDQEGRDVALAIGGAEGLPVALVSDAERVWSLSLLTFPHELARVIVLEQLYRAFTIRRGEPYHRAR
jgi:23S rRNA (pseudouridine1915-N3)-methyltransferase